jgi:hypothetical protein
LKGTQTIAKLILGDKSSMYSFGKYHDLKKRIHGTETIRHIWRGSNYINNN